MIGQARGTTRAVQPNHKSGIINQKFPGQVAAGLFSPDTPEVDSGGERAEEPRGEVDPELMKRDRVVPTGPDHGDVFHGDQHPADENEALDARVARVAFFDDDAGHKRVARGRGMRARRDQLEQISEHRTRDRMRDDKKEKRGGTNARG